MTTPRALLAAALASSLALPARSFQHCNHHLSRTAVGIHAPRETWCRQNTPGRLYSFFPTRPGEAGRTMESQIFDIDLDEGQDGTAGDLRYSTTSLTRDQERLSIFMDDLLRWIPVLIPVLSFALYDPTAALFATVIEHISNNNWVAVDGGAYQAKIIAPAINGVVVPSISILFATLIGTTITTLRQRQLDIRTAINMEAGQLRILQSMIDAFPSPAAPSKCRLYLLQYTSRLIAESQPTVDVNALDFSLDSELNGLMNELNYIAKNGSVPGAILAESYGACSRLYEERARRITALRSTFPFLHYMIVSTLAISISVAFLLETNQSLLVFLNAIQLRVLWTMLVGTFSALAIVCYDLGNPFRGSYQISKSVDQLYTIRLAIRASHETNTINGEVSRRRS